jgi:hypothetical protein
LEEKVAALVYTTEITAVGIRHADYAKPLYPQKLALTSPSSGGRSVGTVRSRTQATEFNSTVQYFIVSIIVRMVRNSVRLVYDEWRFGLSSILHNMARFLDRYTKSLITVTIFKWYV